MIRSGQESRRRYGATLVETAVSLGVFLVFMLGIYEYGRFLFIRNLVENATREGARQAVAGTNRLTTADIQNNVRDWIMGQIPTGDITSIEVEPAPGSSGSSWANVPYGQSIMVRTTVVYRPLFPTGFDVSVGNHELSFRYLPDPVTIRATSTMQSEAN